MPKLLVIILVLIAVLFAVGIGFGRRQQKPESENQGAAKTFGNDHSKGGIFAFLSRAAGSVSASDIAPVACLHGKQFIVNGGVPCKPAIAPAGRYSILKNARRLTLKLSAGGPVEIHYDYNRNIDKEAKDLKPQVGTLPSDQSNVMEITVLEGGGPLELDCRSPTCVVEIQ